VVISDFSKLLTKLATIVIEPYQGHSLAMTAIENLKRGLKE
jgi:hypothetical protein